MLVLSVVVSIRNAQENTEVRNKNTQVYHSGLPSYTKTKGGSEGGAGGAWALPLFASLVYKNCDCGFQLLSQTQGHEVKMAYKLLLPIREEFPSQLNQPTNVVFPKGMFSQKLRHLGLTRGVGCIMIHQKTLLFVIPVSLASYNTR